MAFSPVPEESKSEIDRAGQILASGQYTKKEFNLALALADKWRACHAYPINTFQATLRTKLKKDYSPDSIAAQRLKRMPTIIDKLRREDSMRLSAMQDIGGIRAILNTIEDVYSLKTDYQENRNLEHELSNMKDYIENPRDEDGYRGIHLIYKYRNSRALKYNGLRIELRIRTRLQHTWATAVESMGTFLGQALKSRQGDIEWIDFFTLISSAFAEIENTAPIARFSNLTWKDKARAIARVEKDINALYLMKGISTAVEDVGSSKKWSYHLLVLDSLKQTVTVKSYNRKSFQQAVNDYRNIERRAVKGEKIEPVLVSVGTYKLLRRAYPNFFLDIKEFVDTVSGIIDEA